MIKLSPQSAHTPDMMTVMEKMRDTWDGLKRGPQVGTMQSIKEKLDAEHVAGYSAPDARAACEYGNGPRSQCEALKPASPERPDYRYRSSRHDDRPPLNSFHEFVRDIDTGTVEVNSDVERDALLRAGRDMLTGLHGLEEAHLRALHLLERSDSNWHRGRRADEDDEHHLHHDEPDDLSEPPQGAEEVGQPDSQRYWVASEPDDESIRGIIPCRSCGSWHGSGAQDRRYMPASLVGAEIALADCR